MNLLGRETRHYVMVDGEVVSFFLPADKLDMIHSVHDTFGAKVLSTSTNDYKGVPATEVVVGVDMENAGKLKALLNEQQLLWYAEGGNN